MYMHFYNVMEDSISDRIRLKAQVAAGELDVPDQGQEKSLDEIIPRVLGTDYYNLIRMHQAIQYDPIHLNCQK